MKFFKEIIVLILVASISYLLLKSKSMSMPEMLEVIFLLLLIIIFGGYAAFFLREAGRDERELWQRAFAGRIALFFSTSVLLVAIIFTTLKDTPSPWFFAILISIILGKIIGRWYGEKRY